MSKPGQSGSVNGMEIAVIGMACHFPGAKNIEQFWENLRNGVESISFFSDKQLLDSGVPATSVNDPKYIKAYGALDNIDMFAAAFFGFTPREAEMMDPQHRAFLECAWESIDNAGCDPGTYPGAIGVYAGVGLNTYLMNLSSDQDAMQSADGFTIGIGADKDFLTTRVSYKLNLTGPSIVVQTACSTSLVAVHMACEGLQCGTSDMALAGGVTISARQTGGYLYQEGGIGSSDGHCRAFDAESSGTTGGSGVGVVVLKRLEDALADGDAIHAVIKGSAVNNDGALKVGYTAPSVQGQANVITMAHIMADVEPSSISYVEAHGTGTELGDPVEIAALTEVFQKSTSNKRFCGIGSVKTNIGHLDTASGIAGLIKTILALKNKMIPPSLHFHEPNPRIDFANGPFYVNARLAEWKTQDTPRRAGVSSFGIGGTNAHVVIEEAPAVELPGRSRSRHLLVLSAKTASALKSASSNLADHMRNHPDLSTADVASTLQSGRAAFEHRRIVVCTDLAGGATGLEVKNPGPLLSSKNRTGSKSIVFMFPGQGSQYVNMGLDLYESEHKFREQIDLCAKILQPHLGLDLRAILYPDANNAQAAQELLDKTFVTQPALFVVEYALARLWMEWRILPESLIGHSLGEYVAACLSGVFSLEAGLTLVAARGRLMQQLREGAMLLLPLAEAEALSYLTPELSLAAVNAPAACVASGPVEYVSSLQKRLGEAGLISRRLRTSHAFHSAMMDPILETFAKVVSGVRLSAPQIPYLSNVTGDWITEREAKDPAYWVAHLRQTVQFAGGIQKLLQERDRIFIEVGPGRTLASLSRQNPTDRASRVVLASLPHPNERTSDVEAMLNALGRLWLEGTEVNWPSVHVHERRLKLALPGYPFERKRFWIDLIKAKVLLKHTRRPEILWSPFGTPADPVSAERSHGSTEISATAALAQRTLWGPNSDDTAAERTMSDQLYDMCEQLDSLREAEPTSE
jgi:phthiocerol/phenolphthiocerol synthesis type-I polyketide synthase E